MGGGKCCTLPLSFQASSLESAGSKVLPQLLEVIPAVFLPLAWAFNLQHGLGTFTLLENFVICRKLEISRLSILFSTRMVVTLNGFFPILENIPYLPLRINPLRQ